MLWHSSFSPAERGGLMIGLLRLVDVAIVLGAGIFAFWLRNDIEDLPAHYALAIALGAFSIANAAQAFGLYDDTLFARLPGQYGRVTVAWVTVVTILIVLAYFTKTSDTFSRLWAATWFLTVSAGLIVARAVAISRIERWRAEGKLKRRVALVGSGEKVEALRAALEDASAHTRDLAIVGAYAPETLPGLLAAIKRGEIDEVVVSGPGMSNEAIARVMHELGTMSIEVRYAPNVTKLPFPVLGTSSVGAVALFDVHHRPLSIWRRVTKRLEDVVFATIILVLISPLMAVIAVLVRASSPGPVLFRQRRLGFNNNPFTLFKFRTMYMAADERRDDAESEVPQARRDDPRVTAVGRFLRRTSLDELPQLFNVIRGEMSLVGPRPHALAHNEEYARLLDGYLARHRVKPGMTGWAQVNGLRGETDTLDKLRARVEHDLYYINHWSLWLDFKILVMTVIFGFVHRNAY